MAPKLFFLSIVKTCFLNNLVCHALQCYQCGTYVKEKPILLGALARDTTYDDDLVTEYPACNDFNASQPVFWVTCKPEEKACLKGWLTQVSYILWAEKAFYLKKKVYLLCKWGTWWLEKPLNRSQQKAMTWQMELGRNRFFSSCCSRIQQKDIQA